MSTVLVEYAGMVEDQVRNAHAMAVAQILPLVPADPVVAFAGVFLLLWTTNLVLFGKSISACKDDEFFCGNTFTTFKGLASVALSCFVIYFYSMILGNGLSVYGVSPYAFVPFLLTYLIIRLVLWLLFATTLLRDGDKTLTQADRNDWWKVSKFTVINVFQGFNIGTELFYILILGFLMK